MHTMGWILVRIIGVKSRHKKPKIKIISTFSHFHHKIILKVRES